MVLCDFRLGCLENRPVLSLKQLFQRCAPQFWVLDIFMKVCLVNVQGCLSSNGITLYSEVKNARQE